MEQWTVEHRMFAYDAYVQNGESVTAVQWLFHVHFKLGRRDTVPSHNTILRWIHSLRTTGSIVKKQPPGLNKTVWTPENIEGETSADSEPRAVCTKTRTWNEVKSWISVHNFAERFKISSIQDVCCSRAKGNRLWATRGLGHSNASAVWRKLKCNNHHEWWGSFSFEWGGQ